MVGLQASAKTVLGQAAGSSQHHGVCGWVPEPDGTRFASPGVCLDQECFVKREICGDGGQGQIEELHFAIRGLITPAWPSFCAQREPSLGVPRNWPLTTDKSQKPSSSLRKSLSAAVGAGPSYLVERVFGVLERGIRLSRPPLPSSSQVLMKSSMYFVPLLVGVGDVLGLLGGILDVLGFLGELDELLGAFLDVLLGLAKATLSARPFEWWSCACSLFP